jgi:Domain of unknown function (DUF4400)
MKPNFWVPVLSIMLFCVLSCSLLFDAWNQRVDRSDEELRTAFLGSKMSQRIEMDAKNSVTLSPIRSSQSVASIWDISPETKTAMDLSEMEAWASEFCLKATDRVERLLIRVGIILYISPYLLLILMAFIVDGLLGRRIKQLRFDYPSPLLHRLSLSFFLLVATILGLLLLAPLPFAPQEVVAFTLLLAWVLEIHLLHLPKRL